MDSRFRRDLRLLIWAGGGTAALILGAGFLALRRAYWNLVPGAVRELAIVVGIGAAALALAGAWAGWIVRRVRAGRGAAPKPGPRRGITPPGG
jgi:hypothetical protein